MSQRLTRKDIKKDVQHDQFRDTVQQVVDYALENVQTLVMIGVALVAVILGSVGVYTWLESRQAQANEALAVAMTAYQGTITADDPDPDHPSRPSFASEEARRARAKELFEQVPASTEAGSVAGVYLGRIALEEGDSETARARWQEYIDEADDDILVAETYLNLIALDREQGREEELVGRLEGMLDSPDAKVPGDALLFELAKTYEQLGREQEALDAYRRLVEEFSASAYSQEAQQRRAALGGAPSPSPFGGGFPAGLTGG